MLVHGATGTSGLLAVQVARALGASRVVAAGRNADGLARAGALGADAPVPLSDGLAGPLAEAVGFQQFAPAPWRAPRTATWPPAGSRP